MCKIGKNISYTDLSRALGLQEVEAPLISDSRHMKWQGWQPYAQAAFTQGNIAGTHFCWRLSRPQGHCAVGRIKSLKNPIDPRSSGL